MLTRYMYTGRVKQERRLADIMPFNISKHCILETHFTDESGVERVTTRVVKIKRRFHPYNDIMITILVTHTMGSDADIDWSVEGETELHDFFKDGGSNKIYIMVAEDAETEAMFKDIYDKTHILMRYVKSTQLLTRLGYHALDLPVPVVESTDVDKCNIEIVTAEISATMSLTFPVHKYIKLPSGEEFLDTTESYTADATTVIKKYVIYL